MPHRLLSTTKVLVAAFFMTCVSSAVAQVITDLAYELATLSEPELLVDWTASGSGVRSGVRVTTTAGNIRTYTHSNLDLDNAAFLMDVVISAELLGVDEDRGARFWVQFSNTLTPPMHVTRAEIRLYREAGTYKVGLFNTGGAALVSLSQDWTNAADRLRIRLRYQEVAGVGTIFLVAENSSQWAPDLTRPLSPGPGNTLSLPVNSANFPSFSGLSEFGFGNFVAGSYYADYESVWLIRSSDPSTLLPVLPVPVIPTLRIPAYAVLVLLLAIAGRVFLLRH